MWNVIRDTIVDKHNVNRLTKSVEEETEVARPIQDEEKILLEFWDDENVPPPPVSDLPVATELLNYNIENYTSEFSNEFKRKSKF